MEITDSKRAELARTLDYITSEELRSLAGINEATEVAWRKRGIGPRYARLGTLYYYPREAVAEFLRGRIHERKTLTAKAVL